MGAPFWLVWLDRVFVLTSLASCLAWIAEYSVNRGWRNSMGRTLLAKTSLLAALLALSGISLWFGLNRDDSITLAWVGVILLGAIGPVMLWRMVVFRRIARVRRFCPAGHQVPLAARFCPGCGLPASEPSPVPGDSQEQTGDDV